MHHYFEAITNTSGDSLVGYFARVIDPATQNTITMSADDNGTPIVTKSGVENMGSTDDYGNLDFYVVPGTYHLDIYAPNATSFIFRVPSVAMNSSKGDPGETGATGDVGPSDATFASLAALKAIDPAVYPSPRLAAASGADGGYVNGPFTYQTGNFTGRDDVVKVDSIPLTTGALVRQGAASIAYQADAGAPVVTQAAFNDDYIAIHTQRYAVETDDLAAWNRARAKSKRIRFVAGKGSGASGIYLLNGAPVASDMEIFGDGASTVIRPTIYANGNCFLGNSGSGTVFIDNVTFRDMTLQGYQGFLEPEHLIRMSGARNLKINNVRFIGWRGDAVYVGSGEVLGQQRFNKGVYITNCYFDGVDNDNRNGISVIDGNTVVIDKCEFYRCTRSNMPGPIDFEPDGQSYHTLGALTVTACTFRECGGNFGQIGFLFPAAVSLPKGVYIAGNKFYDYIGTGADIAIDMRRQITGSDTPMQVVIEGNTGSNGNRPIDVLSAIGVTISASNVFQNYRGGNLIGFTGADNVVRDIRLAGVYTMCGTTGAVGSLVNRATNVEISATFDRCGTASASGFALQFGGTTSSGITLRNLKVVPAAGQTVAINNAGHTFTPATNKMLNVDTGGLISQFLSSTEGQGSLSFSNGWSDAGGTLAYKNGEGRVFIRFNLAGGTLTSGTLIASLPVGFRPIVQERALLLSGTGQTWVRMDPDGSVFLTPNAAAAAALAGSVSFNSGQ